MARKTHKPSKTLAEVVAELGRYPYEAFEYLLEGLTFTVEQTHGPMLGGYREVFEWMEKHEIELSDLPEIAAQGKLPPAILAFLAQGEGLDNAGQKLNRHVSGEQLCWGLRQLAIDKWGLLAPAVLRHWGIRATRDFGEMVFVLVNNRLLQKQPEDEISDFDNIYDFDRVFIQGYKVSLTPVAAGSGGAE